MLRVVSKSRSFMDLWDIPSNDIKQVGKRLELDISSKMVFKAMSRMRSPSRSSTQGRDVVARYLTPHDNMALTSTLELGDLDHWSLSGTHKGIHLLASCQLFWVWIVLFPSLAVKPLPLFSEPMAPVAQYSYVLKGLTKPDTHYKEILLQKRLT